MAAIAHHPFRTALETQDGEALAAAMHPDVSFHSPALDAPLQGRERALGVYASLAGVLEDYEIVDELAGEGTLALVFRLHFDGHRIDGVDHLRFDDSGLVRSIVVTMRPLEALQALSARMIPMLRELGADGDAARVRVTTWSDPRPSAEKGVTMPGLDYLRALRDGELPPPPIAALLGFRPEEVEKGRVKFAGVPEEVHYNPIGMVHAGYAATLLDSAMGCAIHSTLPAGRGYATLEFKVNLVRPVTSETGPVECVGEVVHIGATVATAEGRLVSGQDGKLLATGTTTCLLR